MRDHAALPSRARCPWCGEQQTLNETPPRDLTPIHCKECGGVIGLKADLLAASEKRQRQAQQGAESQP